MFLGETTWKGLIQGDAPWKRGERYYRVMEGENFERGRKREFGDDPRDASHFARFRKLNEQRIAWLRRYVAQKAEEVWVVRCFDSPMEFVRRFPDADQREEMLYEQESIPREVLKIDIASIGKLIPWSELP